MITKYILIALLFSFSLVAQEFTLASYNVQNLFDLKNDKSEYKEYIPNTKSKWNKKAFDKKLKNISKVIKEINADIIVLQEIESKKASKELFKKVNLYKYSYFYKSKKQAVGLSIYSKFKIIKNEIININSAKFNRAIVKSTLLINKKKFIVFNNHWPSKRNTEASRVKYALVLYRALRNIPKDQDYVLIGDFNSNYNENETFRYDKKLNDTSNLSAINDVLYTSYNNELISKQTIKTIDKRVHYNTWLDLLYKDRFSYIFRGKNSSPDNILLPSALFDNKNFSYVNNSFTVFKKDYLITKRKINRWKIRNKVHQAEGYSDHLAIKAKFSSKKYTYSSSGINSLKDIYLQNNYKYPIEIKKVSVIYKHKNLAILKAKHDRAIVVYKDTKKLELGFTYDVKINKIKEYNGLKEITKIEVIKKYPYNNNYKEFFLNAKEIDIMNENYINDIITNISGIYKNRYLYFDNKKIRVYSKNKDFLPKNGESINIINAHLSFYRDKMQITIHKKSDINVN